MSIRSPYSDTLYLSNLTEPGLADMSAMGVASYYAMGVASYYRGARNGEALLPELCEPEFQGLA